MNNGLDATRTDYGGEQLPEVDDVSLLRLMSQQDIDFEKAKAAWGEFFQRHRKYVYGRVLGFVQQYKLSEHIAEDIVVDTFDRAFRYASSFKNEQSVSHPQLLSRVRAWLCRIAVNLIREQSRMDNRTKYYAPEYLDRYSPPAPLDTKESPERLAVRKAVNSLSEKEQQVLSVTFQYHRQGRTHQRLPNDVARNLADLLKTTPENLRQIRRRALSKITKAIESKSDQELSVTRGCGGYYHE